MVWEETYSSECCSIDLWFIYTEIVITMLNQKNIYAWQRCINDIKAQWSMGL